MASDEDLARMRAAAVQAALDGNVKMAAGIMAVGKMIENAQDKKSGDKDSKKK